MNQNKIKLRKAILDSFPDPTKRNPDGTMADTTISDLIHNDDPMIVITECKFLWEDRYLEKGRATRGGTFYNLTQKGIEARDTIYNPVWIKKMEKEMREAKENAIPRAFIGSTESYAPGRRPTSEQYSKPKPTLSKNQKLEVGGILGFVAIVITVLVSPIGMDWIFPPQPEINVSDLNAQDGIVEGNKFVYSYEPRTLTPNGTKNEIFTLKVSNIGDAEAHDFWIDMKSQPDGLWFDFQESAVIDAGNPISCQQKKSYCTIGLIPKEYSYSLQYSVKFDHKLIQEIVDETPKLFFIYDYDEGEEQKIEVFLKFD